MALFWKLELKVRQDMKSELFPQQSDFDYLEYLERVWSGDA
jgi:hypothetical protein